MRYLQSVKKYRFHHIFLWLLFFAGWYLFRAGDFPNMQSAVTITIIKVLVLAFLVYLVKIHKSYIIASQKVDSIEGNDLKIGSHALPISRNTREEVLDKILRNKFA